LYLQLLIGQCKQQQQQQAMQTRQFSGFRHGLCRVVGKTEQACSTIYVTRETPAKFALHAGNTKFNTQNEK
jgi:hypothetical protein